MKASLGILMLLFSSSLVASQAKQESSNQEVSGTIKDVSINVRG
jgi:hypothetical protein